MNQTPEQILKSVFGFDSFLPLQGEVIANVLNRRDTLAIMATGSGKSLCYQIPAMIFAGLTVVVSPLISLMKDQVDGLLEMGVPAIFLNSSLSIEDYQSSLMKVMRGEIKLLYISPESLLNDRLLMMLSNIRVDCLTIDEAHCISQWGHDFRPEYRQLAEVRARFPEAVCFALTATATPRVRQDIRESLKFKSEDEFVGSFNRRNLFLEVRPKLNAADQVIEFIRGFPDQSGIIYCATRKQVDELAYILQREGFSARSYHAGMEATERQRNQEAFIHDEARVIVATIAFGMGIDKPDVRFVVHYDLPKSMENYYQEIGRGGRDGLPTHCLLLYSYGDTGTIRFFINQMEDPEQRRIAYFHLDALLNYAESADCRRIPLLAHFGEAFEAENCATCDNCRLEEEEGEAVERVDITIPAQMFLSCVKRTGELFGASHVTDVLRGSKSQRVLKFKHQDLSTHGIGMQYSHAQWMQLSRQLIQKGLLNRDTRHGSLKLTPRAYQFLKDKEKLYGTTQEMPTFATAYGLQAGELVYDRALFEKLREKRKALADQAKLPPYTIFHDRSLIEMATYLPQSIQSMAKIYGVGARKLETYGDAFLEIIVDYCNTHDLPERPKAPPRGGSGTPPSRGKWRYQEVGEMYDNGQSVEQIAAVFSVKTNTIIQHLERYRRDGHSIRASDLLALVAAPEAEQQRALEAFEDLGAGYLAPIFEALEGRVSYDDLRILRLHYLSQQKQGGD
jgi:ATP-dependent DNA helicase RecQ